ncbi:VHS1004 protein [Vibrio phage 1]|nr:VHS1004 protein [Vibrio phage 1]
MIGSPPPRPGSKAAPTPEPKKTKRTKPLVIKAKGKAKVKAKAIENVERLDRIVANATPERELPLIAQFEFFGQWQILNDKPTSQGYNCACVCGATATLSPRQLGERPLCNHRGSDQNFRQNREAAKEFKALVSAGLIPNRWINFNVWLKRRAKVKRGYTLITVAPGFMWDENNLIEVASRQRPGALQLQALYINKDTTALLLVKELGLKVVNVLSYLKEHGEQKTVDYLLRKGKKAQYETN